MLDFGVLGFYLALMVAIGLYFSRQQKTSGDFFLAGRSMSWFPVGLSIMATLLSALSYTGIPGEAYRQGLKFLLMPLAIWLTLPIIGWVILPLYNRLKLYSIYEYLEFRFDCATRLASSGVFVIWRLLWLGGVLYAPCKVLVVAAGWNAYWWATPALLIVLGLVGTLYTFLGGMKAVIWTDVIQSFVMIFGVVVIIGGVWATLDGGPDRVWEIASSLGRTNVTETSFQWSQKWSLWGILPHFFLSMLSFYVADQITAQRFLTAKNLDEARRSFALNCLSVSIMIPALMYVGMSLLAYYHDHPRDMNPKWVVNVDGQTRDSITYGQRDALVNSKLPRPAGAKDDDPLIDWNKPDDKIDPTTIDRLVEQQRIMRPNIVEPLASADELIVLEDGRERIAAERLAKRDPTKKGKLKQPEIIVHKNAYEEMLPRFLTFHLPIGLAGLILAALFAASMSSMDSGLNSICTLLVMDFHRRLGWGRKWLAGRLKKPPDALTEADELRLGRPMVLLIGVAATLFSLLIAQIGNIFEIMIGVVNTFGGPLLAVFMLGLFARRVTARGALIALIVGTVYTVWLMLGVKYGQTVDDYGANQHNAATLAAKAVGFVAAWLVAAAVLGSWHESMVRELRQWGGSLLVLICIVAGIEVSLFLGLQFVFRSSLAAGFLLLVIAAWSFGIVASFSRSRAYRFGVMSCLTVAIAVLLVSWPSALTGGDEVPVKLDNIWPLFFGIAFTLAIGYLTSLVCGREKSPEELRGLVVGIGELGIRELDGGDVEIGDPDELGSREQRWK